MVGPHQYYDLAIQHAQADESLFAVVLARIFARQRRSIEDRLALSQIDRMLDLIAIPLTWIEGHDIYRICIYSWEQAARRGLKLLPESSQNALCKDVQKTGLLAGKFNPAGRRR